ncbi:MAG: SH3 domain-containing protein, partial [Leptospiraceae bacterium]|nr:SH3 domain-containing protein [Leptospiraceae bacterium]
GYIYQKEFSFEIPSNIVHVDNLEGVKLYENIDSLKVLKTLPHKAKLEILEIIDRNADKLQTIDLEDFLLLSENNWLRVKYNNQEGYIILDDSIQIKPKIHYFFVVHTRGLDLHLEPSVQSPIVTNIPKNTIGEILEANPDLEKHGSLEGYWFKTEYKSKVGWGFSGYIVTSLDPNYFEEKDVVYDEEIFINFLSSSEILPIYSPKKIDFKKSKIQNLNNYKILEVNYDYPLEDCSVTTNSRIIFQNLRRKEFYSNQNYYEEKILSIGEPFPENIYT